MVVERHDENLHTMRRLLWKWGNTLHYVRRKEAEISNLRGLIDDVYDTLGATWPNGQPKASGIAKPVERAVESAQRRVSEYERAIGLIETAIADALRLKAVLDGFVDALPDELDRKIIALRYVDGHRWGYIGLKLSLDESVIRKRERATLREMCTQTEVARFCPFS